MSILSDEEKRSNKIARDKLRLDLLFKDGDIKKVDEKKKHKEMEIEKIKHEQARLAAEMIAAEKEIKKLTQEEDEIQREVIKEKRDMNSLQM